MQEGQFKKTRVQSYNINWPLFYDNERRLIKQLLNDDLYIIHHIGSTAVPGMHAKPIIDIVVVVNDIERLERYMSNFESLGYAWEGDYGIEGRRFLRKTVNNKIGYHLHCYQVGHSDISRYLIFRNYLIANPDKANKYSDIKQQISVNCEDDPQHYREGKAPIVEQLLKEAFEWYESKKNFMEYDQGKNYDTIAMDFALIRDAYTEGKYLDLLMDNLPSNAHVLDIGCGSGQPIASYFLSNNIKVTGVDSSKELLNIAKRNHPKIECIFGDMRNLELNETYDAIIAWDSLFHLPKDDQKFMIAEFSNWLNQNGFLVFTTGDEDGKLINADMFGELFSYYSLSPKEYTVILEQNGFQVIISEKDQGEENHRVWVAKKI